MAYLDFSDLDSVLSFFVSPASAPLVDLLDRSTDSLSLVFDSFVDFSVVSFFLWEDSS